MLDANITAPSRGYNNLLVRPLHLVGEGDDDAELDLVLVPGNGHQSPAGQLNLSKKIMDLFFRLAMYTLN